MSSRTSNMLVLSALGLALAMPSAAFAASGSAFNTSTVKANREALPPAPLSMKNSGATPGQPSDASLTHEVRRKLENDPVTRNANIEVHTQDRMVTLRGRGVSPKAAHTAARLASHVNGVRGIKNYINYPNNG